MHVKALLLGILLAFPARADWPRLVIYEKGDRVDKPQPYPLVAFTAFPWRTLQGDVCYPCAPQDIEWAKSQKARTELRPLGTVNGLHAYDLFYYWREETEPGMKSILIQTAPDEYHEIYHDEPNEGTVKPSFIVRSGSDQVVCVLDNVYRLDAEEDCFFPENNGVVRMDFHPVWDAAQRVVPRGRSVWAHGVNAKSTFEKMIMKVRTISEGIDRCCDTQGAVNVQFKLERGLVVVLQATFDPDAESLSLPKRQLPPFE